VELDVEEITEKIYQKYNPQKRPWFFFGLPCYAIDETKL